MTDRAVYHLDELSPDLRYAVQFCPGCRHLGNLDYLLCGPHALGVSDDKPVT